MQQCPNHVLRASRDPKRALQPEMGFEHGYCRPECTTCGEVCPTGAIRPVTPARSVTSTLGLQICLSGRCRRDRVPCDACGRHCPVHGIYMVSTVENDPSAPKVPADDRMKCIGCGACEHLCAARPLPAMTVKGLEVHREVKPMGDEDILAETRRLFAANEAAVVLVKDGVIATLGNGRGLYPMINI